MPRTRRGPVRVPVPPLDATEVEALWRKATRRGPYPEPEACEYQAAQLNAHLGFADPLRLRVEGDKRVVEALKFLLKLIGECLKPFNAAARLAELPEPHAHLQIDEYDTCFETRAAVVELLAVFDPFNFRLTPEWAAWFAALPDGDKRLARLQRLVSRPALTVATGHRTHPPLWEDAGIICWLIAQAACGALGRTAGHGPGTVAVELAVLFIERLGWRSAEPTPKVGLGRRAVTARALARRLAERGLK
jgi:hypothetical protein